MGIAEFKKLKLMPGCESAPGRRDHYRMPIW